MSSPAPPARGRNGAAMPDDDRLWDTIGQWLVMAALLMVAVSFKHYGISWDEPLHVENGWRALDWYSSLGQSRAILEFQNLYLYGALYDVASALAELALPFDPYESRRLLGGLVGVAGLVAVRRLARTLGGPRAGALAVLLLLLTPDWLGQAYINPKDIPFATAACWVLLAQTRILQELPRPSWPLLVGYGVALGAALGIRVGGVILLLPLAMAGLIWLLRQTRALGWRAGLSGAGTAAGRLAPALLLAWALMIASWPWAQEAPFSRPWQALTEFAHFPLRFNFLFAGQMLETTDLPWWYAPVAFAVKLPEVTLLGLLAALGVGLDAVRRRQMPSLPLVGIIAFILLPLLIVIATGTVLYDGIRHLLFLMPALTLIAALGLDSGLTRLERIINGARLQRLRLGLATLLLAWIGWQGATLIRLHPYEFIWYNSLTGGVAGAAGRFELDYWGTALSEAAGRLRNQVVAVEGFQALATPYRVRICGPHQSALYYLPPRWEASADGQGPADFYIAFTRSPCADAPQGPRLLDVERMGVELAYVLDLRRDPLPPPLPLRANPGTGG